MVNLTINGESQVFSAETLGALVEQLGMKPDRVAIELNREIVSRGQWPETRLRDGDQLEIVHFVGGGSGCVTHFVDCHPERSEGSGSCDGQMYHRFGNRFRNLLT